MPSPIFLSVAGWLFLGIRVGAFFLSGVQPNMPFSLSRRASVWCSGCPRVVLTKRTSWAAADCHHLHMLAENDVESPVDDVNEKRQYALDTLIEQFTSPENGNLTAAVDKYLDFCDHAFLTHLRGRIASAGAESTWGIALRLVEEGINMAMQRRLAAADTNLRRVLDLAPDIKAMEGKIRTLFREGEVDMAFIVTINMNLQGAKEANGAENAVKLLTHLTMFMMDVQDEQVNPELKLLRSLLRTECDRVRKSMLQEHLQITHYDIFVEKPLDTNKVQPKQLRAAIQDMIAEVGELGQAADARLTVFLRGLQVEIDDVIKSSERPGPYREYHRRNLQTGVEGNDHAS